MRLILFEIAGWLGATLILTAYGCASLSILTVSDTVFQLLNLCGAACLIAASWHKQLYPLVVLNLIWSIIAAYALVINK